MDDYCKILGIETLNRKWLSEFESLNPRAIELKDLILISQKTIKELRESDALARQSVKGATPAAINMLFSTNRITEEKRDELLSNYEACQVSIAYNNKMIETQLALERDMKDELSEIVSSFVEKKKNSTPYKAMQALRFIAGFMLGTIGYAVGFVFTGLLFNLSNLFVVLPATIDLDGASVAVSAMGANIIGYALFQVVNRNKYHSIAFCIWLIVIASIYLTLCIIGGDWNLIQYSVISFIFDGVMIAANIKGEQN